MRATLWGARIHHDVESAVDLLYCYFVRGNPDSAQPVIPAG
jgi:hypothetical protein